MNCECYQLKDCVQLADALELKSVAAKRKGNCTDYTNLQRLKCLLFHLGIKRRVMKFSRK